MSSRQPLSQHLQGVERKGVVKLTKEQVIGIRTKPSNLEYLQHIEELPMYVANHRHRRRDVYDITLLHQQLFRFGTYRLDQWLGQ